MSKRPVFFFFPTETRASRVSEYLRLVVGKYKNALTAISFSENDDEMAHLALHSNFFHIKASFKDGDMLMRRAFALLSQVIFEKNLEIIVFNTAMLRYDTRHFTQFVDKARALPNNLVLGTPQVLHIDFKKELEAFLADNEAVRKALMVDIFISYVMSKCDQHIFGTFTNLFAGLFAIRPDFLGDPMGVLRAILATQVYKDTDLLAPFLAWNIFRTNSTSNKGLSLSTVQLPIIKLAPMANCLENRISDLRMVLRLLQHYIGDLSSVVDDIFTNVPIFRSVFTDDYRPWFEVDVLQLREYEKERIIPPESPKFKKP